MGNGPLIYLIAGEPSGDAIGGRLMAALEEETGGRVRFTGIGGSNMTAEGLASLFPIDELSVMGLVEVVPSLPRIIRRIAEVAADIEFRKPDIVVTVDSPSFAIRVLKRLSPGGPPKVHFVAPTVWAWRPWRVHKFKRHLDHLLAILPFEPPWFEDVGLPCTYVGHPVLEYGADRADGVAFRTHHEIAHDTRVICVLPGSRRGEVERLSGIFEGALTRHVQSTGPFRTVIPTVPSISSLVRSMAANWPGNPVVVESPDEKYAAMRASNLALAASGTVALELALAGVPTVVAYRVSPLTAVVARRLIKVRHVNLVNILLDREVVPELIQENCRAERLAAELGRLSGPHGDEQIRLLQPALDALGRGSERPSLVAARTILSLIARRGKGTTSTTTATAPR